MDRGAVGLMVLVLFGVLLVVTAPPDPQYSVSIYGPTDTPTDESVVAFEDLSEDHRELFLETFDDGKRFGEPPDIGEIYVSYQGYVYRMSSAAHEGSVFSVLMSPLGGLFVIAGFLVAVYRRLYRS